jgi:type VI protein secretion system component Hcp
MNPKLFDRASPRLLQALVRGEVFPRAELKFYIAGGEGALVLARTWILDGNVFVVALNSSTTSEGVISESLRLWSCRLTFRDELTGATGGVDFCTLRVF